MKEYRAELISTYLSVTYELNTTINALVQEGWELESMHPLYQSNDTEIKREILLLFSRNRKEQLVLPLTYQEIQLILNAFDGYALDNAITRNLLEKLEAYRKEQSND